MIAGCIGTSNVLCGQMFDVPVKGTHAHSWIMSFPDELTAFRTYAKLYPSACILLVDTYDTLKSGIPHAIQVFKEMREAGIPLTFYGIRMDSGDLAYLSKEAKKMLDAEGFTDAVISASNDLDEGLISSLKNQGATINSWGVGTNLITSKDCPSFGGVYKLAADVYKRQVAALVLPINDLVGGSAEDEHVLSSHLLGHLHIGSVHGADGKGSVSVSYTHLHRNFH